MQRSCLKAWPEMESPAVEDAPEGVEDKADDNAAPKDSIFMRFLNAILDGGKNGVELGLAIIPGVLIITTMVILITFGPGDGGVYDGSSGQGVPILPWLAQKIHWVFEWLFGFADMRLIAFPMAIAVFTAIGMCWSGFLSTHTAMLDTLGYRKAISKAIGAHTVAGLCAGIIAHFLYLLLSVIGIM